MNASVKLRRRQAMNEITLRRTGHPPVRFYGEPLASASGAGQRDGKKPHLRWYEITLYRSISGAIIVHVAYRTRMDGEVGLGHDFVDHAEGLDAVAGILRAYNPIRVVVGHAASVERNFRADKLEQAIRRSYDEVVSDLFAVLDYVDPPGDLHGQPLYFIERRDGDLLDVLGGWRSPTYALGGHRDWLLGFQTTSEAEAAIRALALDERHEDAGLRVTTLP